MRREDYPRPADLAAYVKERRCRKTGAQLTAGDVLRELNIESRWYADAYEVLRRASEGLGIDHVDSAGRGHKLYTWGDVSRVAARLEAPVLRQRE